MKILWIAPAILFSAQAFAEVRLSVVGDVSHPYLSSTSNQVSSSVDNPSSSWGLGGGLLLGVPIAEYLFVQTGALYVPRVVSSGETSTAFGFVEIPVQLRYWLTSHVVVGVGGYYAQGVGSAHVSGSSGASSVSFSDLGVSSSDYGAMASLGVQKHLATGFAAFLEGQFLYGLKDVDLSPSPSGATRWTALEILFGLRFAL